MLYGLILLLFLDFKEALPVIHSRIDKSEDIYETSIEKYKGNEFWGIWSMPLSNNYKGYLTRRADTENYPIKNIQDYNLNTAWVARKGSSTSNPFIEFTFTFPKNTAYAGAYQFRGICNVFNGYCKSLNIWKQNARVKRFKVYINNNAICYVEMADTWHFQSFDISAYFKNQREGINPKSSFEIRNGDKIRFEITEIYPGQKFQDVAISEFLCEGGSN